MTEVVVVSIGPKVAQEQIRTALALGADRGILIETEEKLESLTVAKLLKAVVEKEQPQIVLMGKQTIDSDNNQTGQMLGALTGMAQGTFASEVAVDGDKIKVTREIDEAVLFQLRLSAAWRRSVAQPSLRFQSECHGQHPVPERYGSAPVQL